MFKVFLPAGLLAVLAWNAVFPGTHRVPVELFPNRTFAVVRVADLAKLDREFLALGLPGFVASLTARGGIPTEIGLDYHRPWYFLWAEGSPKKELPFLVIPLGDVEAFRKHPMIDDPTARPNRKIQGDHAIMGIVPVPETGGSPGTWEFSGDIEGKADLDAMRRVFAAEIGAFRNALQGSPDRSPATRMPEDPVPGENREEISGIFREQSAVLFGFLDQSDHLSIRMDLAEGNLDVAVRWSLGPETAWGKLIESQHPRPPSGLGRVVRGASLVSWASLDLTNDFDLVEPFYRRVGALLQGMDPEVLRELMQQRGEMVLGGTAFGDGVAFEGIYSVHGEGHREFQEKIRALVREADLETPGVTTEYRPKVGKVEGMEVDLLVREFSGAGRKDAPLGMDRLEAYYGWGKKETFSLIRSGSERADWVDRMQALASGSEFPLPDAVRKELAGFPEKLLMFAWVDPAHFLPGVGNPDGGSNPPGIPSGYPPIASYVTSQGSRLELGGSLDLQSWLAAAAPLFTPTPGPPVEEAEP